MHIRQFGSIYEAGQAMEPGFVCKDSTAISFGDTVPGRELKWIQDGELLIANRCVCTNISWVQLSQLGFVYGAPVQINGRFYLCRCLKVSSNGSNPNEWDALLDKYSESNELWHWRDVFFWGQEFASESSPARAIRGDFLARLWNYHDRRKTPAFRHGDIRRQGVFDDTTPADGI